MAGKKAAKLKFAQQAKSLQEYLTDYLTLVDLREQKPADPSTKSRLAKIMGMDYNTIRPATNTEIYEHIDKATEVAEKGVKTLVEGNLERLLKGIDDKSMLGLSFGLAPVKDGPYKEVGKMYAGVQKLRVAMHEGDLDGMLEGYIQNTSFNKKYEKVIKENLGFWMKQNPPRLQEVCGETVSTLTGKIAKYYQGKDEKVDMNKLTGYVVTALKDTKDKIPFYVQLAQAYFNNQKPKKK